jgi:hypothetical protein
MFGSLRGAAVSLVATALAASSKKCPVAAGFSTINYLVPPHRRQEVVDTVTVTLSPL